jgi:hypothetical protein
MEEAQLVNLAWKFDLSLAQILFLPIKPSCGKKSRQKFNGLLPEKARTMHVFYCLFTTKTECGIEIILLCHLAP